MLYRNYRDSIEKIEERKPVGYLKWICYSPFTRFALPSFLAALVVIVCIYWSLLHWLPQDNSENQSTCHLLPSYYVPCLPGKSINQDDCLQLGCCWREDLKICFHAFPSRHIYTVDSCTNFGSGIEGFISAAKDSSPTGRPTFQKLGFYVKQINENRVRIGLKTNAQFSRTFLQEKTKSCKSAEVTGSFDFLPRDGNDKIFQSTSAGGDSTIDVFIHQPRFSITLARSGSTEKEKRSVLLSTARGPLIVTKDYWEWTLYLTSGILYGLNNPGLNGSSNWIYNNENETTRAAFLAVDPTGNAMSCFIDYAGPLEVQVLNESNLLILRGLSSPQDIGIEVMSGPTGLEAMKQLAEANSDASFQRVLGSSLLGLHVCPEQNSTEKVLESLKNSISFMEESKAPWDSHCVYRKLGLALGHELTGDLQLVEDARKLLKEKGKSLATHLTPMIFNEENSELRSSLEKESCLLYNKNRVVYTGYYEMQSVVYPDWTKLTTQKITKSSLDKYKKDLSPEFIILRDSWPKDEKENALSYNQFDYLPEAARLIMSRHNVPFNLENGNIQHYMVHNAYADQFTKFVGGSSVFIELRGHSCNSGGAKADWTALQKIVHSGIVTAMLGRLPTAMYVCGADTKYQRFGDDELCLRWYAAAVPWPRIIALPEKSPGSRLLSRTSSERASRLLRLRATLATYQHTVLATYAKEKFPIFSAASLFDDDEKRPRNTTSSQFFWGDSILVGLVILPGRSQLPMWIPGKLPWRHLDGGAEVKSAGNKSVPVTSAVGEIITLVRPGKIVPLHKEAKGSTSETVEQTNLILLANVIRTSKSSCQANGTIYYDDGTSDVTGAFLRINLTDTRLTLENVLNVKKVACNAATSKRTTVIEAVQILGGDKSEIGASDQDLCKLSKDVHEITIKCS